MFKKPDSEGLRQIAQETRASETSPQNERYVAAMIDNAMAIAERQDAGTEQIAEQALLHTIYGKETGADWPQLADDLRSGTISEDTHPQLLKHLIATVQQELAISNPGFLVPHFKA
ncbi:MAG: hypothetical protein HN644_08560 [Rhodospirillales bacterium]|jgi:hypothetical protein|nr:hypothetical protein [Rhodospirillales bacterium]MBT4041856.1 hypothetical protein [Rhodospirillales bacterium]MBT4626806.1 hypothetical protein [Rhodospirillales bacterium]MBT5351056.1 hypothetical protein [Rhodospirillales bacterium]MBT5521211.1 hypothetical protein [Rhodospirillales bacterium]